MKTELFQGYSNSCLRWARLAFWTVTIVAFFRNYLPEQFGITYAELTNEV